MVKNPPAMQETQVQSLGQKDVRSNLITISHTLVTQLSVRMWLNMGKVMIKVSSELWLNIRPGF